MVAILVGLLAACAASALYNIGVALQAREARGAPQAKGLRPSLLGELLQRRWWLVGTALGLLGWPLQALAFTVAPVSVVQPALGFGLIILLVLGARMLGERVGAQQRAGVAAIVIGVALLAVAAPPRASTHATPALLATSLTALAALALLPYVTLAWRSPGGLSCAFSAGVAFAWSGLSTKFAADAATNGAWGIVAAWTLATGLASLLALLSEMSALQRRPATVVAPLVFNLQVVLPVLVAPLIFGERWATSVVQGSAVAAGLAIVAAGAFVVTRSPGIWAIASAHDTAAGSALPVNQAMSGDARHRA